MSRSPHAIIDSLLRLPNGRGRPAVLALGYVVRAEEKNKEALERLGAVPTNDGTAVQRGLSKAGRRHSTLTFGAGVSVGTTLLSVGSFDDVPPWLGLSMTASTAGIIALTLGNRNRFRTLEASIEELRQAGKAANAALGLATHLDGESLHRYATTALAEARDLGVAELTRLGLGQSEHAFYAERHFGASYQGEGRSCCG